MIELDKKLKHLRKQFEYTQEYIARKLDITQQTYQRYEKGTARPTYEKLVKLANLYEVTIDFLLGNF